MLLCLYRMRMITEYASFWWKSSIRLLDSTFAHHKSTLEALAIHYESCSVSHVHTLAHTASTADGSESSLQHQHGCASFAWVHLIRWNHTHHTNVLLPLALREAESMFCVLVPCEADVLFWKMSRSLDLSVLLVKVKWFPGSDSLKVYWFLDSGQF